MKCRVCGSIPSGMHYGALTCEGCKAFFRRMARENIVYNCLLGGTCTIDRTVNRSCCKACRYRKCVSVGMELTMATISRHGGSNVPETILLSLEDSCTQTDLSMVEAARSEQDYQRYLFNSNAPRNNDRQVPTKIVTIMTDFADMMDRNRICKLGTVEAVRTAVNVCFDDQLSRWSIFRDRCLLRDERPYQPETTLDTMVRAVYWHNRDSRKRAFRFVTMLPGMDELDLQAARGLVAGWKWLSFWLLHQAPFLIQGESYMQIEDQKGQRFHFCRYWQDMMTRPHLNELAREFCAGLNAIGLTQMETFLLVAVIMFEPDTSSRPDILRHDAGLKLLHRHYTDVLIDVLKNRCTDRRELTEICQKLARFFGALKLIYQMYTNNICRHFMSLVLTPREK